MPEPRPRWSPSTKLTVLLLLLGLGIFLLYHFQAAITPLILALLLAYILSPIVTWIQKHLRQRRGLATLLAYLALLVILIGIPLVIVPPLSDEAAGMDMKIQRFVMEIEAFMGNQVMLAGYTIDPKAAFESTLGSLQGLFQPIFSQGLRFVVEAISSLVWVIFIIVISFYLVKDSANLNQWLDGLAPPAYREDSIRLRREIDLIWRAFLLGQITLALVVAVLFTIIGFILGLPYAFAMGALAGLLEFLPSLGHGIWMTIAVLLALLSGSTWLPIPNWAFALLVAGLHLIYQQFDLNYLIPRIVGRRVQLPPLVIILGIVTGALVAGVLGVVLAAPTIASARVLGRYIYAELLDQDPFPGIGTQALPPPNPRWWRKAARQEAITEKGNLEPIRKKPGEKP
jgi:predicted PurR-regulated permease PerM